MNLSDSLRSKISIWHPHSAFKMQVTYPWERMQIRPDRCGRKKWPPKHIGRKMLLPLGILSVSRDKWECFRRWNSTCETTRRKQKGKRRERGREKGGCCCSGDRAPHHSFYFLPWPAQKPGGLFCLLFLGNFKWLNIYNFLNVQFL